MSHPVLGGVRLGSTADTPRKKCSACGQHFFTQVGLDEHLRLGDHTGLVRRWTTGGRFSPAGLASMQERGRAIAAANNAQRRRCSCGRVSTPAGLALHQMSSGHVGWSEAPA